MVRTGRNWKRCYFVFLEILVFHPTNLKFQLEMSMKFAEQNFEKPIVKIDFRIEEMNFEIDPKQFSDLLDFVKFQNYSVFYGIFNLLLQFILISFVSEDRCREYRQLYLKEYLSNSPLTSEESNRIYVRTFHFSNELFYFELKILESKLDVYSMAYIRHSVELEVRECLTDFSMMNWNIYSFIMKVKMKNNILGGIGGGKEKKMMIKV